MDQSILVNNLLSEMNILSLVSGSTRPPAPGSAHLPAPGSAHPPAPINLGDDTDVIPRLTSLFTRTLTITTCYTEDTDADAISDICSRRVSVDSYTLDDYLEESCGSTLLTIRTTETCLTNPTDIVIHELTPLQMVKIPASRLRQLEYIEKHLSSIVQSAVHESVK
jgi:hypothetical protein